MTTYSTYQEAKIANPSSEIYWYIDGSLADVFTTSSDRDFAASNNLCNPADYCITVEKFLVDGNKFVEGDVILRHDGKVIKSEEPMIDWSIPDDGDSVRYILRATALSKPKRTKTEYIRIAPDVAYWTVVKEWSDIYDSNIHYSHDGSFLAVTSNQILLDEYFGGNLFKRIETEIDWRDEVKSRYSLIDFRSLDSEGFHNLGDWTPDGFVKLCHLVAELTDKPTN